MQRVRSMLSEAAIQLHDTEGSKQVAYHRYLATSFTMAKIIAKTFVFQDDRRCDKELFDKLHSIVKLSLSRAEELLLHVVEIDGEVMETIKNSGSQIAGKGAEPLIVDTEMLFRGHEDLVKRYGLKEQTEPSNSTDQHIDHALLPRIPESRLRLDCYALMYHVQLLLQKLAELERRSAKEQSNAIFLTCLQHTFSDYFKVVERLIEMEMEMISVEQLELRNELMTVDKIACEISLIDRLIWSRLVKEDLLQSRLKAVNTVRPILDYFHYLVGITMYECCKCESARDCADTIVFFVHIADRLMEHYGDHNAASAIIMALDEQPIREKWPNSFQLLPEKVKQKQSIMQKYFSVQNHFEECRQQFIKHPKSIPPILALIDQIQRMSALELPRETVDALNRVIKECSSRRFSSQRPDIQHWLLTRPFKVSFETNSVDTQNEKPVDTQNEKVDDPKSNNQEPIIGSSVIPDSLLNLHDPTESIHDDMYEQIFGVHAHK